MTDTEILEQLQPIFQSVLENGQLVVTTSSSADQIPEWDSLNHATLVAKVQQHFDMKFSLFDVLKLKTVGDMVDLIARLSTS